MSPELRKLKIKYLKLLFAFTATFFIILGVFNYYKDLKALAYIEFIYTIVLLISFRTIEKHYRTTILTVLSLFIVLMYLVVELHLEKGVWSLALWFPVAVLSVSLLVGHIGAVLASLYILTLSAYFLLKRGTFWELDTFFYWIQLIMSMALVSLFFFAFSEMWKRYETILREKADIDQLTGVYTRTKIFNIIESEARKSDRYGHPFCVIMVDLDNFKEINDQKGHLFGDEVLKQIAQAIKGSIRKVDYCGRYGGDEFIVVTPHTTLEGARTLAERIRETVKDLNLGVTTSIGVVQYREGTSVEKLVQMADEALYRSKQMGKDRVTVINGSKA